MSGEFLMRHRRSRNKLGMRTDHREAMLRNMVTSLLEHERIVTTDARAKTLRGLADQMITLGKKGDLHARRQALQVIRSKEVIRTLFEDIAPRYAGRDGGYVRVIKKGFRPGDRAAVSVVELVEKKPDSGKSKGTGKGKSLKEKIVGGLKSRETPSKA
jgi:large subunit ribosomal protein L17